MILPVTLFNVYLMSVLEASHLPGVTTNPPTVLSCSNVKLDIVMLIEGTTSLQNEYPKWRSTIEELVKITVNKFESTRIGLASFTDKPIPFRGQGLYGNFQSSAQDYCYLRHFSLAEYNDKELGQTLEDLSKKNLTGRDPMQGQLEALLLSALDSQMRWNFEASPSEEVDPCSLSVILMFTASQQHRPNDAYSARNDWNWERSYLDGYDQPSFGGFGSDDFPSLQGINLATDQDKQDYDTLVSYFHIMDGFEAGAPSFPNNLTQEQLEHFEVLMKKFGPYPYPAALYDKHPGDASVTDCSLTEYPAPSMVGKALAARSIMPVFFITPNVYNYYQNQLLELGTDSIIIELGSTSTPEELADTLFLQLGLPASKATEPTFFTSSTPSPSQAVSALLTSTLKRLMNPLPSSRQGQQQLQQRY